MSEYVSDSIEILEDLENRFTYHPPKGDQLERYEMIREAAKNLAILVVSQCPVCRELTLAIGKIEEAVMWANSAIARHE